MTSGTAASVNACRFASNSAAANGGSLYAFGCAYGSLLSKQIFCFKHLVWICDYTACDEQGRLRSCHPQHHFRGFPRWSIRRRHTRVWLIGKREHNSVYCGVQLSRRFVHEGRSDHHLLGACAPATALTAMLCET